MSYLWGKKGALIKTEILRAGKHSEIRVLSVLPVSSFLKVKFFTDILKKMSNRMMNRRIFDSKDQEFRSQEE